MRYALREYQKEAIEALRANMRAGIRRQVLCSPTGSGKTEIAIHMIAAAIEKNSRVFFVCDRQTLVNQTSKRFWENDLPHGVLMGDDSTNIWHHNLICSAQTLESRPWMMERHPPDLVIMDECHELRRKILAEILKRDHWAIGLSATPFTRGLDEFYYEKPVNVTTTTKLIREQYLSPVRVVAAKEINLDGLRVATNGEWSKDEVSQRVVQVTGEMVEDWERHTQEIFGGPVPTIVFCPSVADSEAAAERFQRAGHDFRAVTYRQKSYEKEKIIEAYKNGEHMGLISCVSLSRGFDAPLTRCMIDAYPLRRALAMHIQKLGRIMRIWPGKEFGLLIDMAGNWLGFYEASMRFFDEGCDQLDDSRLQKVQRKQNVSTSDHTCRDCEAILPPGTRVCPWCGAAQKRKRGKLQEVTGELIEVDGLTGKRKKLPYQGDWWPELCAGAMKIASGDAARARKIALAQFKAIFGKWPRAEFQPINREPDPAVQKYTYNQYRRYLAKRMKA